LLFVFSVVALIEGVLLRPHSSFWLVVVVGITLLVIAKSWAEAFAVFLLKPTADGRMEIWRHEMNLPPFEIGIKCNFG
jgi:hypothetical protein